MPNFDPTLSEIQLLNASILGQQLANSLEPYARQTSTYGHFANATQETLAIILGDGRLADRLYDKWIYDGGQIESLDDREFVEFVRRELASEEEDVYPGLADAVAAGMYGVLENPGCDNEQIVCILPSWTEALRYRQDHYFGIPPNRPDIVKMTSATEWTTEF